MRTINTTVATTTEEAYSSPGLLYSEACDILRASQSDNAATLRLEWEGWRAAVRVVKPASGTEMLVGSSAR
jgi:hypothetical protein